MKKIIFLLSAAFVLVSMPAFAQNTFEKAKDTNAAGKSAVQSQSDTDARNIGNQSWDCADEGGGTSSTDYGRKTVSLIGGNKNIDSKKDEKPCFDKNIVPADITPWKSEFKAMFGLFAASLSLLFLAGMFTGFAGLIYPTAGKIGLGLAIAAAAGFIAALALAIVIMTKYGQKALGGMWVALSAIGLALCALVMFASCDSAVEAFADSGEFNVITRYCALITFLACGALGAGMGGTLGKSNDINKKYQQDQICPTNPEHEVCSNDEFSMETGNLL